MARLTLAGGKLDEYGDKLPLGRLFNGEVIEGLKVSPTSTASTSVQVAPGSGFFRTGAAPGNWAYPFVLDTTGGLTVAAPTAQSQPMLVDVVAALDLTAISTSSTNNPNSWALYAVGGTPNASPVRPTDAQIQSAIGGSSKPYIKLAWFQHNSTTNTNGITVVNDVRNMARLGTGGNPINSPIWWEELARTKLAAAANIISVNIPVDKKYIKLQLSTSGYDGNLTFMNLRFNNDDGTNYGGRVSQFAQSWGSSRYNPNDAIPLFWDLGIWPLYVQSEVLISKNPVARAIQSMTSVQSGSTPSIAENITRISAGAWYSTASINNISVSIDAARKFSDGAELVVLGHD